jgi:hypothetical protein
MRVDCFFRGEVVNKTRPRPHRLVLHASVCLTAVLLLYSFTSYLFQANQHVLPYRLKVEELSVLPEGLFVPLFVAVMLALFVAIRLSASQRTSR